MTDTATVAAVVMMLLSILGFIIFIGLIAAIFKINGNIKRIYELLKKEVLRLRSD